MTFEKKTGRLPFWKKLTMPLSLEQSFIRKLKACVMFCDEAGAEVTILNETELRLELDGKEVYPFVKI